MDSKDGCVGESFESCDDQDSKSVCVGRAYRAYFYEFNSKQHNSTYPGLAGAGYGITAYNFNPLALIVLPFLSKPTNFLKTLTSP